MTKGLEALHKYKYEDVGYKEFQDTDEYKIIEKELKALDIIKKKCIFNFEIVELNNTIYIIKIIDDINKFVFIVEKKEFELLKEVLENE